MASLVQIKGYMRDLIRAEWDQVLVYEDDPGGTLEYPSVLLMLDPERLSTFNGSFGTGSGEYHFLVRVLVDRTQPDMDGPQLDNMLDPALSNSVASILHDEIADANTTFHVEGIRGYGSSWADGSPGTGADLLVTVRTTLTPV